MAKTIARSGWCRTGLAALVVTVVSGVALAGSSPKLERRAADLVRKQSFAKAVVLYEDISVKKPHVAGKVLGPLYAALGWNDRAFAFYAKMVRRYPNRAWYWYCLGYAAKALKKWSRAVAAYRRALRLAPKDPSSWYGLALSLVGAGKRREAVSALETYIRLERRPWAGPWLDRAGRLVMSLGGPSRSKPKRRVQVESVTHPRKGPVRRLGAWANRTKALVAVAAVVRALGSGKLDEAEKLGWQSLRRYPGFPKAYLALSRVLEKKGQWRRAMGILRLGLRRLPAFPAGRVGLARIALEHGDSDEANLDMSAFARHPSQEGPVLEEAARVAGLLGRDDWRRHFLELREGLSEPKPTKTERSPARPARQGASDRGLASRPGARSEDSRRALSNHRFLARLAQLTHMVRDGRCMRAQRLIEPLLAEHPKSYDALVLSAEALLCVRGDMNVALSRSLAAARMAPNRYAAWRTAGLAALRLRGRKVARTYLTRYLNLARGVSGERSRVAFVKALVQNLEKSP